MRKQTWFVIGVAAAIVVAALNVLTSQSEVRAAKDGAEAATPTMAVAVVHGLGEHKVEGKVLFTQKSDGVEIVAELTGLKPGEHGFHVHEFGDCSMMDGKCAGGHFNPTGMPHGAPDSDKRHAGDFGNIKADSTGKAAYHRIDTHISLSGANSIIGRSVILHAKADDLKTQPSGDAGDRIGCGVIGIADPKLHAAK
jgi:Cu-Zn family superoxide dismutase